MNLLLINLHIPVERTRKILGRDLMPVIKRASNYRISLVVHTSDSFEIDTASHATPRFNLCNDRFDACSL